MYYDHDGSPLTLMEWAEKLELPGYKRVAYTDLGDGRFVSTVWMGLDMNLGLQRGGLPLIFETMVFGPEKEIDFFGIKKMVHDPIHMELHQRYSTIEQAQAGHEAAVAQLRPAQTIEELIVDNGD